MRTVFLTLLCLTILGSMAAGQTKRNTRPANPKPAATPQRAVPDPTPTPSVKRNERPQNTVFAKPAKTPEVVFKPSYVYEFSRPDFVVSSVIIEHDELGRGRISFLKKGLEAPESDPITLSAVTLDRIRNALAALNFLDSTESYQYEKDYSHLGNISITYRKGGRERTAKYNWTTNENAKVLMEEYRKIGIQYVWRFDMEVARENQPLNAPSLMDELDSYIRRNEISDPKQMVPLLRELSNDERIPLIARNHATKLVERIENKKK
jgi:hypothetical protein